MSAKDCPAIFAVARATCRFLKPWYKRRAAGPAHEIRSRRLRIDCAGQPAGGRVTSGGRAGQVAPHRWRNRCDGAIRGRKALGAEVGEYLEFAGTASHRDFASRNQDW